MMGMVLLKEKKKKRKKSFWHGVLTPLKITKSKARQKEAKRI